MTEAAARSWRASPRWMKLLLILSLVGNFVVIGALVGASFHMHDVRRDRVRGMERMIMALPEGEQEKARALAADARPAMQAAREERRAARRAYAEILGATPFDEAAFDAALARMIAAQEASRRTSHEMVKTLAAGLSDAGRAALAERLNRRRGHWRRQTPPARAD